MKKNVELTKKKKGGVKPNYKKNVNTLLFIVLTHHRGSDPLF